jgi:hypothetical protein
MKLFFKTKTIASKEAQAKIDFAPFAILCAKTEVHTKYAISKNIAQY